MTFNIFSIHKPLWGIFTFIILQTVVINLHFTTVTVSYVSLILINHKQICVYVICPPPKQCTQKMTAEAAGLNIAVSANEQFAGKETFKRNLFSLK